MHYFKLTYDDYGRLATARGGPRSRGAPGDTLLEFHWDGMQLLSITGYSMQGDRRGGKIL